MHTLAGLSDLIKTNCREKLFLGAAAQRNGKAYANNRPDTVLYRSAKGERQRGVSASKSIVVVKL